MHSGQKLESTQLSFTGQQDKHTVVLTHHAVLPASASSETLMHATAWMHL